MEKELLELLEVLRDVMEREGAMVIFGPPSLIAGRYPRELRSHLQHHASQLKTSPHESTILRTALIDVLRPN